MKKPIVSSTIASLSLVLLLCTAPQARAQGAPNVLFLFLDDMRWDAVGFTGNKVITTPNMDALAAQGTVFESAFSTTAICMVSITPIPLRSSAEGSGMGAGVGETMNAVSPSDVN